jgi:hypothetical protein
MQLPLTSSVTVHGHAAFPFSRFLDWHEGRLDGQQPEIADRVRPGSARRAAALPTSSFPTSGGRVHAHLH